MSKTIKMNIKIYRPIEIKFQMKSKKKINIYNYIMLFFINFKIYYFIIEMKI